MGTDRTTAVPELQRLARLVTGEPREALVRLLVLVCEQLAMDVAFVSTVTPAGDRVVELAVTADGTVLDDVGGRREPLAATWCGRVVGQEVLLVEDVTDSPDLLAIPATLEFGIACYAGTVLLDPDGGVLGTLCALGRTPRTDLGPRDVASLVGLAEVVAPLVARLHSAPQPLVPAQRTPADLTSVADAVGRAQDVEQLSRPLLDALHELTGLASSYLTVIHDDAGVQEIRYSRNTRPGFELPEGLLVPWHDTLCKRSLDEGRPCVTDVPDLWSDSEAAADLGIQVYVSVPVQLADGRVWGTLCAADSARADDAAEHVPTMRLFARLIAAEVEREAALAAERERAAEARAQARTDALTGCASRRVVEPWLEEQLAALGDGEALLVAYADVDAFKTVNDQLGHAAGDAVLVEVGRRLRDAARPSDLVARLGGDEFLVAARLPASAADVVEARLRAVLDFTMVVDGSDVRVRISAGCRLVTSGSAAAALAAADAAMYERKRAARAGSAA